MTSTIPWLEKIAGANGRPVMIAAMFVDPGDPTRVFRAESGRPQRAQRLGQVELLTDRVRELPATADAQAG
jgi:hypothetical protein